MDVLDRFARSALLIGAEGLDRLAAAHVAVFGLGGVGSFAAEALARAGIGRIMLVDHDTVALTNLNRQLVAIQSTLGRPKAEIMADRIAQINPLAVVEPRQVFYSSENRDALLVPELDYVIDAIDTVTSKLDLIISCRERGIPVVSSMGTGNKLDPSRLRMADISKTHTDPLAKVMRAELRRRGIESGVRVIYSDEHPIEPRPIGDEPVERRASGRPVPGSMPFVPPAAGFLLASVVVRDLLGFLEPGASPKEGGEDPG